MAYKSSVASFAHSLTSSFLKMKCFPDEKIILNSRLGMSKEAYKCVLHNVLREVRHPFCSPALRKTAVIPELSKQVLSLFLN